jgi:hypothetical protein
MGTNTYLTDGASAQDARCVVLVYADDLPVGCGFLLSVGSRALLLTCAHVINIALGGHDRNEELPDVALSVAPWFARDERTEARVLPDAWFPITSDGGGDVALLEPLEPLSPQVASAPLRSWGARPALPFQVLGFPAGYKSVGQHAVGVMTGRFGPRGQWVQLDGETSRGARITRGFSGSPVWDTSTQTVVGMVVAEDVRDNTSPCGAMLPIEVIADMAGPVRDALPVVIHPLAALARHVGSHGDLPLVGDVRASTIGATPTVYSRRRGDGPYVERESMPCCVPRSRQTFSSWLPARRRRARLGRRGRPLVPHAPITYCLSRGIAPRSCAC